MGTSVWIIVSGIMLFFLKGLNSSVLDLSNMLSFTTNRNPLDFISYGNWCGLGGSGSPLDSIDRCCKMHDLCYEKAQDTVCFDEKPHIASYRWKYSSGKIHCSKSDHPCGLVSCRCDAKFSGCVAAYKDTYNPRLKKIRPPLYNAINRVLSNINKKSRIDRIDAPFVSIKLQRSTQFFK